MLQVHKAKYLGLFLLLFFIAFLGALARIHFRVQTTLIGYEIGRLKDNEAVLLKKRSLLAVELAKITTKHNLEARLEQFDKLEKKAEDHSQTASQ